MTLVTPIASDAVADSIGFNIKPEDFATFQGPYATMWDSVILPRMAASGVRYARVGVAPPSGDSPAHQDLYFARCKQLIANGIKLIVVAPGQQTTALLEAHYAAMGSAGWVAIEGDNEPSNGAAALSDQTALWSAVQNSAILGPSGANIPVIGPSFLFAYEGHNLQAVCNDGNAHTYIHGKNPESPAISMLGYLEQAQDTFQSNPIWITELGYRSVQAGEVAGQNPIPGVPDNIIARYVPRWALYNLSLGFQKNIFHQLADNHAPSPTDGQSGFGFIDFNGNPKPQLAALQALIGLFTDKGGAPPLTPIDMTASASGNATTFQYLLTQRSDGAYILAFWGVNGADLSGWNDATYATVDDSGPLALSFNVPSSFESKGVIYTQINDDGTTTVVGGSNPGPWVDQGGGRCTLNVVATRNLRIAIIQ